MKKSLAHLPLNKKQELKRLKSIILEKAPQTQFIILFGSHARGNWVDDEYVEDHITYTYKSDFDILVITEDWKTTGDASLWAQAEKEYYGALWRQRTPLEIISHDIEYVNTGLREGRYFFSDIKKEGILLYDSGKYKLERKRKIDPVRRLEIAKEDFEQWFESAETFYENYEHNISKENKKKYLNNAAFELHQATERFYSALILTASGYRPKLHNIEKLGTTAAAYYPEFLKIFPRKSAEEERLFKLLKDAYIDARYKKDYSITKDELAYLAKRVEKLRNLVEKTCKAKIENLKKATV
ncbi:MAG: HEPN domain-containing protein [Victivallaceae bacterium]|nr:HEPN domain-containing protein [Victivallaceae bacterium]